eukprot:m.254270 g.254270  ORF g.254270 m.254270 type:complete len:1076 (+) comp17550_c0_seq1:706-3933(+)
MAAHAVPVAPPAPDAVPYTPSTDPKVQQVFSTDNAPPPADDLVAQACRDIQAHPIASSSASTSSTACSSPAPPPGLLARPKLAKAVPRSLAHMPLIMRAVAATAAMFVTGSGNMDTSHDSDDDMDEGADLPALGNSSEMDDKDDKDDKDDTSDDPSPAPEYTVTHRDLRLSPVALDSRRITLSHGGTRPPMGEVEAELGDEACEECRIGDYATLMLLCDKCDRGFHTFCLEHPLESIPRGDWLCPICTAKACAVNDVHEDYGFKDSDKTYTIHSFRTRCERLERQYASEDGQELSQMERERRFWHAVTSPFDDDRLPEKVEYGADLQTLDIGSGFATRVGWHANAKENHGSKSQAAHPWNINNWPIHRRSLFRFIDQPVSGVKVPWLYVGQLFSSFCWHIEDHWCYSVNYMHRGQPKTWYGVPSKDAPALEKAMLEAAPDLFEKRPDLLHDLVTLASPSYLADHGVDVYRVDQHPGEFIVTFPRAYHAGFNNGFNVAEAVNFAPAHWLSMGRDCFETYRKDKRRPVFNHWELVLKLASDMSDANDCDVLTAGHLLVQLGHLRTEEGSARADQDWELVDLGELGDDDRVCRICNSTCYTSVRKCKCAQPYVCASHLATMTEEETAACTCEASDVQYQASFELKLVDELIEKLHAKVKAFDTWLRACPQALPISTTVEHPQLVHEGSTTFIMSKATLTTLGSQLALDSKRVWLPVATTEPPQLADDTSQDDVDAKLSLGDAVNALKASLPDEEDRLAKVKSDLELQAWLARAATDWRWDPSSLTASKTLRHAEALEQEVKEFVRLAGVHRTTLRSAPKDKVDHEGNRAQFVQLLQRVAKLPTIASLPDLLELAERCLETASQCHSIMNRPQDYTFEQVSTRLKSFESLPTCMRPVEDSLREVFKALKWVQLATTALAEKPGRHEELEKLAERCKTVVASEYQTLAVCTLSQLVETLVLSRSEQAGVKACLHGETSYETATALRESLRFTSKMVVKLDTIIADADAWFDRVAEVTDQGDLKAQTTVLKFKADVDYSKHTKLLKQAETLKLSVASYVSACIGFFSRQRHGCARPASCFM